MSEFVRWGGTVLSMILLLFASAAIAFAVGFCQRSKIGPSADASPTFPIVLRLEQISELATTRVHITDILSAEGEGYRGSWLIVGEAVIASDLSQVEIIAVNHDGRKASIRLPLPRVLSASVNHDKTRTWSVERATWLPWHWGKEGAFRDAAMFHAQHLVEVAGAENEQISTAKLHAEQIVQSMFQAAGWDVEIEWIDAHEPKFQ